MFHISHARRHVLVQAFHGECAKTSTEGKTPGDAQAVRLGAASIKVMIFSEIAHDGEYAGTSAAVSTRLRQYGSPRVQEYLQQLMRRGTVVQVMKGGVPQ